MAILQPLLALLSRSVGRILSALFGWAVVALFGETSRSEKIWLSALVGAAAGAPSAPWLADHRGGRRRVPRGALLGPGSTHHHHHPGPSRGAGSAGDRCAGIRG